MAARDNCLKITNSGEERGGTQLAVFTKLITQKDRGALLKSSLKEAGGGGGGTRSIEKGEGCERGGKKICYHLGLLSGRGEGAPPFFVQKNSGGQLDLGMGGGRS